MAQESFSKSNASSTKRLDRIKELWSACDQPNCSFVVEGEEIFANKVVLKASSPVFEKMFYGTMAANKVIITDNHINLQDFKDSLNFIYGGQIVIDSVAHAWALHYIANKYLLPELVKECLRYVEKNLTLSSLALSYEYADMYGHNDFKKLFLKDMCIYVKGICPKGPDYYHLKLETLKTLLKQAHLNITSNELVLFVMEWVINELRQNNYRFGIASFITVLTRNSLDQYLHNLDIEVNNCNPNDLSTVCLQYVKTLRILGKPLRTYWSLDWCTFCKTRQTYKIARRIELRKNDALFSSLSTTGNKVILFGLVVNTIDKKTGGLDKRDYYNGSISIIIRDLTNPGFVNKTVFRDNFEFEKFVYVPLTDLLKLQCDKIYSVQISFDNFDDRYGPFTILCHHMENYLVDQKRNTTFSFSEMDGSVIKGLCYYRA